jgi:hypothetical protein
MKRAILTVVLVVVAFAGLMELGIVLIDPFYRYNLVSVPHINAQRGMFAYAGRMAKTENICRVRPEQITLGGSKVEVGISPHGNIWRQGIATHGPVYDMGLAGMPLSEMFDTARFVARVAPLKRAVIGLDFMQFNQLREDVVYTNEVVDYEANRISGGCLHAFIHDINPLLGPQAAKYALQTIRDQHNPKHATPADAGYFAILFDSLGFRSYFSIAYHGDGYDMDGFGGHGQETYYVEKIWRPAPRHDYKFGHTLETLQAILYDLKGRNIDVVLFTEPLHARMLLAIQDAGLAQQFDEWKRQIAGIAADLHVPLWDFEAFSSITEDKAYWWEPSHYKKETGDLLLQRMLGSPGIPLELEPKRIPDDFGPRLTPANVEEHIQDQRWRALAYIAKHPDEVEALAEAVAASVAKTPTVQQ